MHKVKRIIIPIDGSYKEYKKFEKIFLHTCYWNKLYFLMDDNLKRNNLKTNNIIDIRDFAEVDRNLEDFFIHMGFEENFCGFCEVDFYQSWAAYKNNRLHYIQLKSKFLKLYNIFETVINSDDIIINNATSHFFQRATAFLANYKNIYCCSYTQSLVPGREYIWVDGEKFKISNTTHHLNTDSKYEEILQNIVRGKKNKSYMTVFARTKWQELKDLSAIKNRFSPQYLNLRRLKYLFEKFVTRSIRAKYWRLFSLSNIPSEKFIFFPLHMPGEAQTLVRGKGHSDDIDLATKVAKCIPDDHCLVVKEHPGYEGWNDISSLKKLRRFPNIIIVDSTLSSHDLIRQCSALVTINSSVWFESFAFEKRVFCFGKGVFSGAGVCDEIDNVRELRIALNSAKTQNWRVEKQMLAARKEFTITYVKHSYAGQIYNYNDNELKNFGAFLIAKIETFELV